MLYAIAQELAAALQLQGVPFPVVFGPEPADDLYAAADRIVIQYRGPGADSFESMRGSHPNPRSTYRRQQGAVIRIYARASESNATWHEHAELAEKVLDHVIAELDYIVRGRRNVLTLRAGGFIEPEDAKGSAIAGGAVYELELAIDRGIERRTWAGAKRPEATIGPSGVTIKSSTKASDELGAAGTPPVDAETAC
jgi:hypothetical protein